LPDLLASIKTVDDAAAWLKQQQVDQTIVLIAKQISGGAAVGMLVASEQVSSGVTNLYIGYLVSPTHQGKGIATELVQGFAKWAGSLRTAKSIIAGVDSTNIASVAVLKKSGFVPAMTESNSANYLMYEHLLNP